MDNLSFVAQSAFPLVWIVVPAIGAYVRGRRATSTEERLEIWQRWWAIGAFGIGSLWMTVAFLAVPDVMATAIGFPRTPFLFEIAFANLGLAIMGFRAASASARERITIGLGGGMFLWGALAGHIYQWFAGGDHAPGNTGGVLITDLLIPAVMIVLAVRSQRLATQPAVR
ncbi:hypothetical protein M8542_08690 [Amycolatopsis sp. OK19-0408]|uniref:Uncharacterized protein n=1 Tax=Amycolatopsis iheyensis TaxID=2945988 RepID=A0A9X2N6J4_9PSEU|nr:DUF6790 family protein [Amycolatopsis iheyensis]MCR6482894.1 hypothetical protein [Amycolatopsis iheyensis]